MSDDDGELFQRAMRGTRPLDAESRAVDDTPKPRPRAKFRRADDAEVMRESLDADIDTAEYDNADFLRYQRPGVGRRTMRMLSRGRYSVQAEIDLHGMTVAEARPRLADFIDYSSKRGHRCVLVVHGKGRGSGARGPVLKGGVNRWLRNRESVLAFVSARQVDGGTGAVYVLLDER